MTTGKRPLRAEVFRGDDGKWYWRTIKNGRELSRSSQGYVKRLRGCIRSLEVEQRLMYDEQLHGLCSGEMTGPAPGLSEWRVTLIVPVKVVDQ